MPNMVNVSSNPQPLSENPSIGTGDLDLTPRSFQSSSYPTPGHPTVSRMDSLALHGPYQADRRCAALSVLYALVM
jgi:hypothetical protein